MLWHYRVSDASRASLPVTVLSHKGRIDEAVKTNGCDSDAETVFYCIQNRAKTVIITVLKAEGARSCVMCNKIKQNKTG